MTLLTRWDPRRDLATMQDRIKPSLSVSRIARKARKRL